MQLTKHIKTAKMGSAEKQAYQREWQAALKIYADYFPDSSVFSSPILNERLSAADVVEGFSKVARLLKASQTYNKTLSLRTISARCFNGDSKFLDERRAFLESAFPAARECIKPRAIMMSAFIPLELECAIFVENFDSFRSTVSAVESSTYNDRIAVIYSAGFRASAKQIRSREAVQFVTINQSSPQAFEAFQQWWFGESRKPVRSLFWGDLDAAAIKIVGAMRLQFMQLTAWKSAYGRAIVHHNNGTRRRSTDASSLTCDLVTGCEFTDTVLSPLLRESGCATDQEVLDERDIEDSLLETFGDN